MVTGLELIPLFLEIGPPAVKAIMKLIPKKETRDFESKRKSVNSILAEMKPLIEGMQQVAGTSTTRPGDGHLGDLKQLIEKVEEGNQLVRKRKRQQKDLEDWIESFGASLCIAMFRVLMGMASNVEQIRGQLMYNQSPQIHIHLHFSEEKYKVGFQKFIDSVNMSRGAEPLHQGVKSVRTSKAKVDSSQARKQSVDNPTKPVPKKVVSEFIARDDYGKCQVKGDKAKVAGSPASRQSVDNSREPVLKKVIFEVLARDHYGKEIVEKAACNVKGVVYAERVVQDNQERDLVIVIATEIFVAEDMFKYLKKKLRRTHVYVKEK